MASSNFFLVLILEMLATYLYVALTCVGLAGKAPADNSTLYGMHMGLVAMVIVHCFGYLSGALLNPSVVLASFVSGIIRFDRALSYLIAEYLGAIAAYFTLIALLPEGKVTGSDPPLCFAKPNDSLEDYQVVACEFLITTLLIFGLLAMLDTRNRADIMPVRFGALMAVCVLVGILNTGTGLNSAIMLAASIANEDYEKLPLYMAGQFSAAIITPFIWKFLMGPKCE